MTETREHWSEKRKVLHDKNEKRFRELKKQIRQNRGIRIPLPGDSRTALQMLIRERRTEEQRRLATEDSLTGLRSRRYYNGELDRMLASQRRGKFRADENISNENKQQFFGVCIGDLRELKRINDSLGHAAGDVALKSTAQGIRQAKLRSSDTAARTGGDEYSFLFSDLGVHDRINVKEGLVDVALRVLDRIHEEEVEFDNNQLGSMHLDMGLTLALDSDTPDSILERADKASYIAKLTINKGESSIVIATPVNGYVQYEKAMRSGDGIVFQSIQHVDEILKMRSIK